MRSTQKNHGKNFFRWFVVITVLMGIFLAVCVAYTQGLWRMNNPSLATYPVRGIDVSHHQGEIDWPTVSKDQVQFVYVKATEGADFKDPAFLENWEGVYRNGMQVGAYHFFTLCKSGAEQAQNFTETIPPMTEAPDVFELLPPAIDLEFAGNCLARPAKEDFAKELGIFIAVTQEHFHKTPVLYTTAAFYTRYLKDTDFESSPLWVRDVWGRPTAAQFQTMVFWQYAENGRVRGIKGPVDLNVKIPESAE